MTEIRETQPGEIEDDEREIRGGRVTSGVSGRETEGGRERDISL